MSAVRSTPSRRAARRSALPYARTRQRTQTQPSGWASITSLIASFNPFSLWGSASQDQDDDEERTERPLTEEDTLVDGKESPVESREGSIVASPPRTPPPILRTTLPTTVEHRTPPPPPQSQSAQISPHGSFSSHGTSPTRPQEVVTQYLKEREGKSLNKVELEGIISMLKKASEEIEPEPFRFSTSPSTAAFSPPPGEAPPTQTPVLSPTRSSFGSASLPTFTNNVQTPGSSRKLSRNPNGVYRWVGAGSAKRPAGGHTSRSKSPQSASPSKLATPRIDTKRRRVDSDDSGSLSTSHSAPALNGSAINGSTSSQSISHSVAPPASRSSGFLSSPAPHQLRASILPKTAPAHPSPLRQSFTTASPPGSPPTRGSPTPSQSRATTYAAGVLTEIIEKVTPPRRPDVSNPYQTASPVKPSTKAKEKRRVSASDRKGKGKEREVEAPTETPKPKEVPTPSPKAIIEATVPKGAKRSRPPASLSKSPFKATELEDNRAHSAELEDEILVDDFRSSVSEASVDDMVVFAPTPKRSKTKTKEVNIEDDVEMYETKAKRAAKPTDLQDHSTGPKTPKGDVNDDPVVPSNPFNSNGNGSAGSASLFSGFKIPPPVPNPVVTPSSPVLLSPTATKSAPTFGQLKTSAPKEPSKLRASFTAMDEDEPTKENETKKSRKDFVDPLPRPAQTATTSAMKDPKVLALDCSPSSLPTFTFPISSPAPNFAHLSAQSAAKALPISSLPTFDFSKPSTSSASSLLMFSSAATPKPSNSQTVSPFNWGASTIKPPQTSPSDWKCSTCDLMNPSSAKDKCTICDAPRPTAPSQPTSTFVPFNFSASTLKPQTVDGTKWKCSMCDLQNPNTAEKCTICDSPRVGTSTPTTATSPTPPPAQMEIPKPPVVPFNWGAAAIKPKEKDASKWTCSTCMLDNPASATSKCTVCDTPRS